MNVLTKIEAAKVLNVLTDATEQLEILSHIPSSSNQQYLSDVDPSESIIDALERLWICEEGLSKIDSSTIMFDSKDISLLRQTHKNIRSVCHAAIATNQKSIINSKPTAVSNEYLEFLSVLNELKMQTYTKLGTTVEDEEKNLNMMHELGDKTRLLEETKRILDSKLKELNYQRERQLQDLEETRNKLEIELKELSELNSRDSELVIKEKAEAIHKATEDHQNRIKELQDKLKLYEGNVKDLTDKDHDEELRYRKDKNKSEAALNTKIDEYNHEMTIRREQLSELEGNYDRELKEYNILKEYFDKVDADIALKAYEASLLKAVLDREKYGTQYLFNNAVKIQKIVRGRQARKLYLKMKSKKNKKKGKGKGKKGKK